MLAKQTKPPARYTEATLLRAMETAGKLVEDDEAAEAMKESGLGTPATRAATIERLIDTEYLAREGKALRATDKGLGLIRMLGDHLLTRPELTGGWEKRLIDIERGQEQTAPPSCTTSGASRPRRSPGSPTRTATACASSAREIAPVPALRRQDRRAAEELLLHLVEVGRGAGLRLHDLEAAGRPHDHPRGGARSSSRRARTRPR